MEPVRTLVQYLIASFSLLEAASNVVSGTFVGPTVPNMCVEFCDPHLDRSQEIPTEPVGGGICDRFFAIR